MANSDSLNVVAFVEATSVTGSAKAVVEFGREAVARNQGRKPQISLIVVTFRRGAEPEDNALTRVLKTTGIEHRFVPEAGRFDLAAIGRMRDLADSVHADVIWTNSVKSHALTRMAGLHRHWPWLAFHHGYTTTDLKMLAYNQIDRWSLLAASRVITVCDPFRRQLTDIGIPRDRIAVQHMPIRTFEQPTPDEVAKLRASLGLLSSYKLILTVGRLSREKGHADLLAATSLLRQNPAMPPFRLVLVGDGPERIALEEAARRQALSDVVIFGGHQPNVNLFYAAADVFVLPSHTEGSPNVLLESMSAGLPVVTTAVGGVPELATDGVDALFVPSHTPSAMADAIQRLVLDIDLQRKLREAGRGVLRRHTPEQYFQSLYSEFVALSCHAAEIA